MGPQPQKPVLVSGSTMASLPAEQSLAARSQAGKWLGVLLHPAQHPHPGHLPVLAPSGPQSLHLCRPQHHPFPIAAPSPNPPPSLPPLQPPAHPPGPPASSQPTSLFYYFITHPDLAASPCPQCWRQPCSGLAPAQGGQNPSQQKGSSALPESSGRQWPPGRSGVPAGLGM